MTVSHHAQYLTLKLKQLDEIQPSYIISFMPEVFPTLTCQNVFFEKDLLNPKSLLILKMPQESKTELYQEICTKPAVYGDSSSMVWNRCQKRLRKAFQILYTSSRYAVVYSPQGQV